MKLVRIALAVALVVAFAACTLKPAWDLKGKWQKVDGKETLEFTEKGILNVADGVATYSVAYKTLDAKRIEFSVPGFGAFSMDFSVDKNVLTIKDAKGKATQYKKAMK